MFRPKLRRVLAFTVIISALSLLPAQAAGAAPRVRGQVGLAEVIGHRGLAAWDFLAGLLRMAGIQISSGGEKGTTRMDPNGLLPASASPSDDH